MELSSLGYHRCHRRHRFRLPPSPTLHPVLHHHLRSSSPTTVFSGVSRAPPPPQICTRPTTASHHLHTPRHRSTAIVHQIHRQNTHPPSHHLRTYHSSTISSDLSRAESPSTTIFVDLDRHLPLEINHRAPSHAVRDEAAAISKGRTIHCAREAEVAGRKLHCAVRDEGCRGKLHRLERVKNFENEKKRGIERESKKN